MSPTFPNTLDLYRLHHGELPPHVAARVREAIDTDPEVKQRWVALLATEAEVAAAPIPPALAALSAPPRRAVAWRIPALLLGLAAVAAAVLLVPVGAPEVAVDRPDVLRAKGTLPDLEVWVGGPQGPRLLRPDEAVGAGDTVQLAAHPRGAAFVSFAGRDGTGAVEVYGTVRASDPDAMVVAPFALTLDDAPGPQWFFALAHDAPASDAELAEALRRRPGEWSAVELRRRGAR